MSRIAEVDRKAGELGLSYGQYKALYDTDHEIPPPEKKQRRIRAKRYKDEDAFCLWQEGKTDAEIAKECGVSRALIQKWRDTLELPSTTTGEPVDTKKYRLAYLQDGTAVVLKNEDL